MIVVSNFFMSFKWFKRLKLRRLQDRFKRSDPQSNPDYVMGLLELLNPTEFATTYNPKGNGLVPLMLYSKNVQSLIRRCRDLLESLSGDLDIRTDVTNRRSIIADDWFSNDVNVPLDLKIVQEELIPAIRSICNILNKNRESSSINYYLRRCKVVLNDASTVVEFMLSSTEIKTK